MGSLLFALDFGKAFPVGLIDLSGRLRVCTIKMPQAEWKQMKVN